jgi:hypothetical protein
LLACFNQLQGLDLHMIPQHRLFWIRMQIDPLVDALRHRMAAMVIPSYETGHKRQKALMLTNRTPILS